MVAISLQIEGQIGLTWPRWKRLVAEVEALGFAGLFRSDHYTNAGPPDKDSLEMIVSLAYLADHTQRIHFGPLVAPLSVRHPSVLARQAAALDDLSGGRMILGVGAGWQEREHRLFGHELGDVPTRMARLEEGLAVITRLLRRRPCCRAHNALVDRASSSAATASSARCRSLRAMPIFGTRFSFRPRRSASILPPWMTCCKLQDASRARSGGP